MFPAPQKGALIVEDTTEKNPGKSKEILTIEFQFNPDSLKRTLKIVSPQEPPGGKGATGRGSKGAGSTQTSDRSADPRYLNSDSSLGQSISITAYFDGKEEYFKGNLSPVLSALEKLMEPIETEQSKTTGPHVNPPKVLPMVFFWWGEKRIMPVKINQLSINETEFTPQLNPIRAEVNIEMELLVPPPDTTRDDDKKSPPSKSKNEIDARILNAYNYVAKKRTDFAKEYSEDKTTKKAKSKAKYSDVLAGGE